MCECVEEREREICVGGVYCGARKRGVTTETPRWWCVCVCGWAGVARVALRTKNAGKPKNEKSTDANSTCSPRRRGSDAL